MNYYQLINKCNPAVMISVLGNCFVCQVATQTRSFLKPGKFPLTDCQALIVESANARVKVLAYHLCTYHLFPCGSTSGTPLGNCFSRVFSEAVVRALASHQCGPGSIPRSDVKCGLSWWRFSPGTPVSPLIKNQNLT